MKFFVIFIGLSVLIIINIIIIIILSPIGHLALADGDMVDLVLAGGQTLHLQVIINNTIVIIIIIDL